MLQSYLLEINLKRFSLLILQYCSMAFYYYFNERSLHSTHKKELLLESDIYLGKIFTETLLTCDNDCHIYSNKSELT